LTNCEISPHSRFRCLFSPNPSTDSTRGAKELQAVETESISSIAPVQTGWCAKACLVGSCRNRVACNGPADRRYDGLVLDWVARRIRYTGSANVKLPCRHRGVLSNLTMSPDQFINEALDLGSHNGVASLDPDQRMVFLISEAEVDCDMNGIDTFLHRYGPDWLSETTAAFEAIGATDIAAGLRAIDPETQRDDPLLDKVNGLITSRTGYDFDAIRRVIEIRLTRRCI